MDGANEADMLLQVVFFVEGEDLKDQVEETDGFEEGNWSLLKEEMISRWGAFEPVW